MFAVQFSASHSHLLGRSAEYSISLHHHQMVPQMVKLQKMRRKLFSISTGNLCVGGRKWHDIEEEKKSTYWSKYIPIILPLCPLLQSSHLIATRQSSSSCAPRTHGRPLLDPDDARPWLWSFTINICFGSRCAIRYYTVVGFLSCDAQEEEKRFYFYKGASVHQSMRGLLLGIAERT